MTASPRDVAAFAPISFLAVGEDVYAWCRAVAEDGGRELPAYVREFFNRQIPAVAANRDEWQKRAEAADRRIAELESRPVSAPPGARGGLPPVAILGDNALKLGPDELVVVSHDGRGKVVDAVKVTGLGEPESMEDEIVRRALADLSLMEVYDRDKARELLKCWGGRAELTVDAGERILAHYPTREQRRSAVFDGVPMHGDGQPVHERGGDD